MAPYVTHNTQINYTPVQSYVKEGKVIIDFNGMVMTSYQVWTIEDARAIATLLTLAIADAELGS